MDRRFSSLYGKDRLSVKLAAFTVHAAGVWPGGRVPRIMGGMGGGMIYFRRLMGA
jgi:hypothetical protein